jgi:outer membrane protein assembly factor BamB
VSDTVGAQRRGGDVVWRFETEDEVFSSPTVVEGTVYIGSEDNNLYALDASDGSEQWFFEADGGITSSPMIVDGTVYIGTKDNNLYAIEASSGEKEWRFETGDDVESSPTVVDDTVYFRSGDENLYALDASDGSEQWRYETNVGGSVRSSPTVIDGRLYITSALHSLDALDASDGSKIWSYEMSDASTASFSSPTIADGRVYIGDSSGNLYALDASNGREQWKYKANESMPFYSSPTVADKTVYIGSWDKNVYALEVSDGSEQWSYEIGSLVSSSPTVVNNTVYVGSSGSGNGNLYALDASDGREQWSYETSGIIYSSPTVADGTVFIGSRDGNVYALDAGVSGSSEDSRVLQGTLGHHNSLAEQGPIMPREYESGSGGVSGDGNGGEGGDGGGGTTGPDGSPSNQDSTSGTGDGTQAGSDDSPRGGVATMFQEPSENAGAWGAILGGGVLGAGYLAYRRRDTDGEEDKAVARECPECGSRVEASKSFCSNCGTEISSDGQTNTGTERKTEQSVRVSDYGDLSVGETVEEGQGYQVSEARLEGENESVWVVTPSTGGAETLDASYTQDFLEDIEPWAKMDDHPNLLQAYGYGAEPLPWLAMEPADYPSIKDLSGDLPVNQSIDVLSQICEAVHHVHRYGIVYENLSAESVKLTNDGQVKLRGALDYLGSVSDPDISEQDVVHQIGKIAKGLLTGPSSENIPGDVWVEIDKALSGDSEESHETVLHFRDSILHTYEQ